MGKARARLSAGTALNGSEGLTSAWALTDGKAGDETQCRAVIEAVGLSAELRRVRPRPPFSWLAPWGPADPRDGAPLRPPWPDLIVASGRRAVPYLRAARRRSAGRAFTVFLKDPRTGPGLADLIWAPDYDPIRGPNVVGSLTSPHRFSPARLAEARACPDPRVAALPSPRVAVLVGGDTRHGRVMVNDATEFVAGLESVVAGGASLAITTSRRTPAGLAGALRDLVARRGGLLWLGEGENPYPSMLALADAIVVTADSINMLSEAVATGVPVLVARNEGATSDRHHAFVSALERRGAIRFFAGRLDAFAYEPLDSTPAIAQAVLTAYQAHRSAMVAREAGSERRT